MRDAGALSNYGRVGRLAIRVIVIAAGVVALPKPTPNGFEDRNFKRQFNTTHTGVPSPTRPLEDTAWTRSANQPVRRLAPWQTGRGATQPRRRFVRLQSDPPAPHWHTTQWPRLDHQNEPRRGPGGFFPAPRGSNPGPAIRWRRPAPGYSV